MKYAKKQKWTDPEKSIKGGAKFLAKEYIQYGQSTLYLQKFDVDDSDDDLYWHQYQQNVSAAKTESTTIMQTYREIDSDLDMPFNFVIPVFENMPDAVCPMPGTQSIVTENIQVTDASIVVYKSKSTSSTKLKTLKKGEKILRIEKGAKKESGHIWDKVVLGDGTKGYIISEGIKKISDVTNCDVEAVAVEPGNLRNGPGTSGTTVLTTLTVGQRVTIIEKDKYKSVDGYGWSRIVLADGMQGYIVDRYVEEIDENGSTSSGKDIVKVVCNGGLTIRKSPGTSSAILGYADKGDKLTRTEKNVSSANGYVWDKVVTASGMTGYVARGDDDEDYIVPVSSNTGTVEISGDGFEAIASEITCEPSVTVANILKTSPKAIIYNNKGQKVTSGNVGTGFTVKLDDKKYTVVKLGDVDCDAKVTSADYVRIKNSIMGKNSLEELGKMGADVDNDGKVTSADYVRIKNFIMGKSSINL